MDFIPGDCASGSCTVHAECPDLRAPGRRGLLWASLLCAGAGLAAVQFAGQATDEVHRVMLWIAAAGLGMGAGVLEVARRQLRRRAAHPVHTIQRQGGCGTVTASGNAGSCC